MPSPLVYTNDQIEQPRLSHAAAHPRAGAPRIQDRAEAEAEAEAKAAVQAPRHGAEQEERAVQDDAARDAARAGLTSPPGGVSPSCLKFMSITVFVSILNRDPTREG